jgi:WXXGXW repeat (2 copies)
MLSNSRNAFLAAFVLVLGTAAIPAMARVSGSLDIEVGPPPPRMEIVPPPRHGYVWSPGYWAWDGDDFVWRDGRWLAQRRGYDWEPDHWEHRDHHYQFGPGHWERRRHEEREHEWHHHDHDHD